MYFSSDRIYWESLKEEEKEKLLDWAVSLGCDRTIQLCDRNPSYPNLIAYPMVYSIDEKDIDSFLDQFSE